MFISFIILATISLIVSGTGGYYIEKEVDSMAVSIPLSFVFGVVSTFTITGGGMALLFNR